MSTSLLSRETLETRARSVWDYLSPSRLNLWLKCPLAFKLRYIDGEVSPTTPAQVVGRMTHRALEQHYRHRQVGWHLDAEEIVTRTLESWEQAAVEEGVSFESVEDERSLRTQTAGLVRTYLHQLPPDEPRPLAVEVALETPLIDPETNESLGLPLLGIVDLILDPTAGPLIIDFKTAARSSGASEIAHEIQLSCYSYLYRRCTQEIERGLEIRSLIKTKTPKIETHGFAARTDRHLRRLFAVIRAYLDELDRGRFVFRPGLACALCDFRDTHCRNWSG